MSATSTDGKIFAALVDWLEDLVFSPVIPIAMPNVPYDGADTYLWVDHFLNQTRVVTIGDDPQQKRGIFQVAVVAPRGIGLVKPLDIAGQIVAHFKGKILFTSGIKITVSGEPWAASPIIDADKVLVPVSVHWHAFEQET